MNNTLYLVDHDLNFLQHDGRPGMKWHTHKFGKWQSQAVYAKGQPNPDAKDKAEEKRQRQLEKIHARGGKQAAKLDAMTKATLDKLHDGYNKGAKALNRTSAYNDYKPKLGLGVNLSLYPLLFATIGKDKKNLSDSVYKFYGYQQRMAGKAQYSPAYQNAYKANFDKYLAKYSKKTLLNYSKTGTANDLIFMNSIMGKDMLRRLSRY